MDRIEECVPCVGEAIGEAIEFTVLLVMLSQVSF